MKSPAGQLLFVLFLTLAVPVVGQRFERPQFRAIVHLKEGGRISGFLDEVENGVLYFDTAERIKHTGEYEPSVALSNVSWVVVKRVNNQKAIRTGIVVGALVGGFLAYRGSQRNPFRSPLLGGISIGLTASAMGFAGALVGSLVGGANRRVIRPVDRDNPAESLERQLKHFTQVYLDRMQDDQP
ncbi:MAG: hypothetical protein EAZ91_12720 [Cytophagales bacterium]|nr:MAG: hypothetical protein EAZ91_12720 [Cytophagales bacterium]